MFGEDEREVLLTAHASFRFSFLGGAFEVDATGAGSIPCSISKAVDEAEGGSTPRKGAPTTRDVSNPRQGLWFL